MSHNKDLKALLENVDSAAKAASNNSELLDAVKMVKDFNAPIKFEHTYHYIFSAISLILFSLSLYWNIVVTQSPEPLQITISAVMFFLVVTPLIMVMLNAGNIKSLSDYIFRKDSLQDNNMEEIGLDHEIFTYLSDNFKDEFSRGNHSREFIRGYSVKDDKDEVFLYKFKYVNSRQETYTSTDSNGNTSVHTRTVYDNFYRYGVVTKFNHAQSIEIKSSGSRMNPIDFKPSSISFSDNFKVGAIDNIAAARFLKPAVVIAIEALDDNTSSLNIEIDEKGLMCISCSNSDLFNANSDRKYSIADVEEFYDEIAGFTEFSRLESVYGCIGQLKRHNDKNFI
jgi:hypothetical protein